MITMKLNKLLLILLIIIIVCCVLVGAVILAIDNNSEEVNNTSSINNTTVATEVNSSPEPVESNDDEVYDPWGYGNDVYHYDAATDTYMIEGSDYHYIYDKVYDEWLNADTHGQFKGSTQQTIEDYIDTVE